MDNNFLIKLDQEEEFWMKKIILDNILMREDATDIIKEIFSELSKRNYFYYIRQIVFDFVMCYPLIFKEEIAYLLDSNQININYEQVQVILCNCPENVEFLIKHLENMYLYLEDSMALLVSYCVEHHNYFEKLLEEVMKSPNVVIGLCFFNEFIKDEYNFDFNVILNYLRKVRISDIPLVLAQQSDKSKRLKDFLISHFEELLKIQEHSKMKFINLLRDDIPTELLNNYSYLINIYIASHIPNKTESMLNIVLDNHEEKNIKDYILSNKIDFIGCGTTSQAFRIGDDKVLKLSRKKHMKDTITEHFLLAPTKTKIIYDDKHEPILYIEKQDYLDKVYNGVPMNDEDLNNYFEELHKLNIILQDPHCVQRLYDNFGFLKDYHDATLIGVNSHEELPDWFKRRPLVLYDIDMIRKKVILKKNTR